MFAIQTVCQYPDGSCSCGVGYLIQHFLDAFAEGVGVDVWDGGRGEMCVESLACCKGYVRLEELHILLRIQ